jgi:hypothetical protein
MITLEDITTRLRAAPFRPFTICMADGKTYDVKHPEQAWIAFTSVFVAVPAPPRPVNEAPPPFSIMSLFHGMGHVAQLSILLVSRLEVHESEQPKASP